MSNKDQLSIKTGRGQATPHFVSLDDARTKLAKLWLLGAGTIFIVIVLQSIRNVYGTLDRSVWGWLLPTLLPSSSMILGTLGATALAPPDDSPVVKRTFLRLAVWLSAVYLAVILMIVILPPIWGARPEDVLELMQRSNLWLGPFQGLVATALGALFSSKESTKT